MSFVLSALAIASGICGTLLTRASDGFTRWGYGLASITSYMVATVLLAWLVQRFPVGVVYVLWAGAATVILLTIDILVIKIRATSLQLCGMGVTLVGVMLLATALR